MINNNALLQFSENKTLSTDDIQVQILNMLSNFIDYKKVQEFSKPLSSQKKTKQKNSIKFNAKERDKMPFKYRNIFAQDNKLVYYRIRPNGVYEARYHRNGIHIEVSSKDLNTLKDKFIKALNTYAEKGNVKPKSKYTVVFNEFAESWLNVKEKTTKPTTYAEYKRLYAHDIAPQFKDKTLAEIDREFLQDYLFRYVEEGKNRTANKLHMILRCIFDLAANDYKFDSPMTKVVLPKYQIKKGKAFTREEEKELVEFCKNNPNLSASSALLVLLYTGMRRSELNTMQIVNENWIKCDTSKEKMGQDVVVREIPITPMMKKVMPFIDFEKAKVTNVNTINSTIKRLFPNHHTHELRYTFITRCKECGINPELVMLWDGHSFDKEVITSVVDRGYTDYSEKYALSEAQKFNYEL